MTTLTAAGRHAIYARVDAAAVGVGAGKRGDVRRPSIASRKVTSVSVEPSDEELMDRYCVGDADAFDALFERYARRVVRFARGYVSDALAEDIAQTTFVRLHESRHRFRAGARLAPWLFSIARNAALDVLRSAAHRREVATDDAAEPAVQAREPDPMLDARVRAAVRELPDEQREVVALHWLGGIDFPEIARMTGASHDAVRARATRAYATLRTSLRDVQEIP